jgi:hypothetical protein
MTRELVMRMRTCAAALAVAGEPPLILLRDAADLLLEASNLLDEPEPIGEPMAVIEAQAAPTAGGVGNAIWGGSLNAAARPCPQCGDISARTVHRTGRKLQITCPACAHQWEYV